MPQMTTYRRGGKTEAQKRAEEERARERGSAAESERRESLLSSGKGLLEQAAIELALEAEQNVAPVDPAKLEAEAEERRAQRAADETRFAEIVAEFDANRDAQYEGLEMMFEAIFRDMELNSEATGLARKLGANNPIARGTMMHVADGMGVPQNKMHLVERICEKIIDRYRKAGAIDRYNFELPV